MNDKTALKEGETLLILQRKSDMSVAEVAKLLEIHPNHLSKIFKSEFLTSKIKSKAAKIFGVSEYVFSGNSVSNFPNSMVSEPETKYQRRLKAEDLTAAEVLKYLEEKDRCFEDERRRHYDERARLLGIIENLTKPK